MDMSHTVRIVTLSAYEVVCMVAYMQGTELAS